MLIAEKGVYLGYVLSHGVDKSSGGFPQLVIDCEASHRYDEETEEYVEVEAQELRAWLILYGKNQKPSFNCDAVKKVFGWDGMSFQTLAEMDLTETRFMFRVSENDYKADGSMQIDGIDTEDASPTRGITSLDPKELQGLDAQYGLAKVAKKTGPKAAPEGAPKPPTTKKKKKAVKKTKKKKATTKASAPAPAPAPVEEAAEEEVTEESTGSTTRNDAWAYISEQIPEAALPTEERADVWNDAINKIHGGPDDDTLTGEEWFQVQEYIIDTHLPF
jgi:hypothetical protein